MPIPVIDSFQFLFNGGRGIEADQIAGLEPSQVYAALKTVLVAGTAVRITTNDTSGEVTISATATGGGGTTVDSDSLLALLSTGSGLTAAIDPNDTSKVRITLSGVSFTSALKTLYDGYDGRINGIATATQAAQTAATNAATNATAALAAAGAAASGVDAEKTAREAADSALGTRIDTAQAAAVRAASTTQAGRVTLARNEDVDATETDTSRVPDVAAALRLARRISAAEAGTIAAALVSAAVPDGGTTGQALVKKSGTDRDTEWKTIAAGGAGLTVLDALPDDLSSYDDGDILFVERGADAGVYAIEEAPTENLYSGATTVDHFAADTVHYTLTANPGSSVSLIQFSEQLRRLYVTVSRRHVSTQHDTIWVRLTSIDGTALSRRNRNASTIALNRSGSLTNATDWAFGPGALSDDQFAQWDKTRPGGTAVGFVILTENPATESSPENLVNVLAKSAVSLTGNPEVIAALRVALDATTTTAAEALAKANRVSEALATIHRHTDPVLTLRSLTISEQTAGYALGFATSSGEEAGADYQWEYNGLLGGSDYTGVRVAAPIGVDPNLERMTWGFQDGGQSAFYNGESWPKAGQAWVKRDAKPPRSSDRLDYWNLVDTSDDSQVAVRSPGTVQGQVWNAELKIGSFDHGDFTIDVSNLEAAGDADFTGGEVPQWDATADEFVAKALPGLLTDADRAALDGLPAREAAVDARLDGKFIRFNADRTAELPTAFGEIFHFFGNTARTLRLPDIDRDSWLGHRLFVNSVAGDTLTITKHSSDRINGLNDTVTLAPDEFAVLYVESVAATSNWTFRVLGRDPMTVTEIRNALSALSGSARIPYSAISGTPTVPTSFPVLQTSAWPDTSGQVVTLTEAENTARVAAATATIAGKLYVVT